MSKSYPAERMLAAGLDTWVLGARIAETMIASNAVIGARMGMLGRGMNGSGAFPVAEFGRLIPEKAAAFGKAQAGASRAMAPAADSVSGGAVPNDGMAMLDWWEMSLKAASAWWLPIHATATSNARRLSRRRV